MSSLKNSCIVVELKGENRIRGGWATPRNTTKAFGKKGPAKTIGNNNAKSSNSGGYTLKKSKGGTLYFEKNRLKANKLGKKGTGKLGNKRIKGF